MKPHPSSPNLGVMITCPLLSEGRATGRGQTLDRCSAAPPFVNANVRERDDSSPPVFALRSAFVNANN